MKYGAIKVGVRNMNSNVRPKVYLEKINNKYWVIMTPHGEAKDRGEVIAFSNNQLDKGRAMVKVIRNSFK